jgi:XTP/dITP diphosphohydrolase
VFYGYCTGRLAEAARGSRGFGYDPAFLPDGDYGTRTMAELTDEEKDSISHRAEAINALVSWLEAAPAG